MNLLKFVLIFSLLSQSAFAALKLEMVKDGLDIVWGMDFIDNETILLSEKSGKIKVVNLKTKKEQVISGNPKVFTGGQSGLLDIKLHPNFKDNNRIFFTFGRSVKKVRTTVLGTAILNLKENKLDDYKDLFIGSGESRARVHFGSRITFDENNKIYFSIGDRGERDNSQSLENHFGKVMRLNEDGTVPKDNPFVGKDGLDEIWSYGHRNPQGLYYDKASKTLYEMEHGPRGGDEINVVEKGKNYGWPKQSYGSEYALPMRVGEEVVEGTEQPIKYYVPSIAPCGLVYYTGERYQELKNKLLSGSLKFNHLNVFDPKTKKEKRLFEDEIQRLRSVSISPDDFVFISTDAGKIYKVVKK